MMPQSSAWCLVYSMTLGRAEKEGQAIVCLAQLQALLSDFLHHSACNNHIGTTVQQGWATKTHIASEYWDDFDGHGLKSQSALHNFTPRLWEICSLPYLFIRPFTVYDNLFKEEEDMANMLREYGSNPVAPGIVEASSPSVKAARYRQREAMKVVANIMPTSLSLRAR